MSDIALTERQLREQQYYDQYAQNYNLEKEVDFDPIDGPTNATEERPWNSYWSIYAHAIAHFTQGAKLLDVGSGDGENALRFARIGYDVEGFDISQKNIEISQALFTRYDMQNKANFKVTSAEELDYPDNTFDVIAGIDILHHVDIPKAIAECHRVLKPGGIALFREPREVPVLDDLRNTRLVKHFFPNNMSFDLHITEDERKLNQVDIDIITQQFPNISIYRFRILARLERLFRGVSGAKQLLQKIDYNFSRHFPLLKPIAGDMIIHLEK